MDDDLSRLGLIDEDDIALDQAALALAALDHDDADLAHDERLLDDMAARLSIVGADAATPAAQADALAAVLGGEFDLAGDALTYDDPANADLISVLARRRGLPVSLSILWVAMARRLGWSAHVLDVPGHVLVVVGAEAQPVIVDPFARGARVDADRLAALVEAAGGGGRAVTHVAAMPNRAVLVRLLQNQASRAEQAGRGRRALELYRRMTVFAPSYPHAWWERARLEVVDEQLAEARSSLGAMLEITRDPALRERVSELLEALATE
ncbi:Regulator of sirC expression, contains transglutaminase-like and TPR domains [Sphingomonas guangdongensis]|uniref:Regulator of sirC expression, contains transglutaminase-like and TPR domains n=1 Tax=Sphingomonas guangdongensis TaxID=1141890 RepID=A0A285R2B7_9SPHN|nr:transglutaminase-like domain-containing protein [Sphingomonas guangdongensis]SOB88256.1 Regulator of sirC expression, contains transglutaminase-like and TPR domains [Sphingomonas guangdongensis]